MGDIDMKKYPGLAARKGRWYVRVVVPKRLRPLAGRPDFRESLNTSDLREAVSRYRLRVGKFQAKLHALEEQFCNQTRIEVAATTGSLEALSHDEIEVLVGTWWAHRANAREIDEDLLPATQDEVDAFRELERHGTNIDHHGNDPLAGLIDQMLIAAGFPTIRDKVGAIRKIVPRAKVNRKSAAYGCLHALVVRALRAEQEILLDVVSGTQIAARDELFNPTGKGDDTENMIRPRTVEDLIRSYRQEREAQHGKESTDRKYNLLFRVMREHWGPDLPVRSINRQRVVEITTFIQQLPPNASKRFPGMTLTEASTVSLAAGKDPMSANTANGYVQNLFAVLRWAEEQDWLSKAPIKGLHLPRRKKIKRRGFKPHELQTLFTAIVALENAPPSKFWVPALSLYSGARAGELCQLNGTDVIIEGDRAFLDFSVFNPDTGIRYEDKRLKTDASARTVPVHPDLIEAGFLDFLRRQGDGRLFPELTLGTKGNYTHALSKWFGRFKKAQGFTQPSLVLHSFRHGFRDACRIAGISDETAQALGGWTTMNVSSTYGARDVLNDAMRAISYGDFRLANIIEHRKNQIPATPRTIEAEEA